MAGKVLAIKGGKLIDGTGRPPVENAVILIEGAGSRRSARQGPSRSRPTPK